MSRELEKAFNKTKMAFITNPNAVFISSVFFSLNFKWDDSVPTAYVDGLTMGVNPDFFLSLPEKQRVFVLAHETWHIALKHVTRFSEIPDGNRLKYNYAADYVINDLLYLDNYTLWPSCLHDEKYRDMSTEAIYKELKDEPNEDFDPQHGDIKGGPNSKEPGSSSQGNAPQSGSQSASGPSQKDIENKIDEIILKASTQADIQKSAGRIPSEVSIHIDKLKNPQLPWQILLHRYMDEFDKTDYSWARPNRRYMPDVYIPTLHSPGIERVAMAWDLSGSVQNHEIADMMAECESIRQKLQPQVTEVVTFDTQVKAVTELAMHDPISKVKLAGRGGTNFEPVFEHFRKTKPNVLIVFTDMCSYPVEKTPDFPVIWVAINAPDWAIDNQKFGEVIPYTSKAS